MKEASELHLPEDISTFDSSGNTVNIMVSTNALRIFLLSENTNDPIFFEQFFDKFDLPETFIQVFEVSKILKFNTKSIHVFWNTYQFLAAPNISKDIEFAKSQMFLLHEEAHDPQEYCIDRIAQPDMEILWRLKSELRNSLIGLIPSITFHHSISILLRFAYQVGNCAIVCFERGHLFAVLVHNTNLLYIGSTQFTSAESVVKSLLNICYHAKINESFLEWKFTGSIQSESTLHLMLNQFFTHTAIVEISSTFSTIGNIESTIKSLDLCES